MSTRLENPVEGLHDYCFDRFRFVSAKKRTLSIFKWEKKTSGRGLKKSKTVVRLMAEPQYYGRQTSFADTLCGLLDKGFKLKKKFSANSVFVIPDHNVSTTG